MCLLHLIPLTLIFSLAASFGGGIELEFTALSSRMFPRGEAKGFAFWDDVLYVAAGRNGILRFDISHRDKPSFLGYASVGTNVTRLLTGKDRLAASGPKGQVWMFEFSGSPALKRIASTHVAGLEHMALWRGGIVVFGAGKVTFLMRSGPVLKERWSIKFPERVAGLQALGRQLVITIRDEGYRILEFDDGHPKVKGAVVTHRGLQYFHVAGKCAFVVLGKDRVQGIDWPVSSAGSETSPRVEPENLEPVEAGEDRLEPAALELGSEVIRVCDAGDGKVIVISKDGIASLLRYAGPIEGVEKLADMPSQTSLVAQLDERTFAAGFESSISILAMQKNENLSRVSSISLSPGSESFALDGARFKTDPRGVHIDGIEKSTAPEQLNRKLPKVWARRGDFYFEAKGASVLVYERRPKQASSYLGSIHCNIGPPAQLAYRGDTPMKKLGSKAEGFLLAASERGAATFRVKWSWRPTAYEFDAAEKKVDMREIRFLDGGRDINSLGYRGITDPNL
ncbi:MAG: hypothetical protein QF473_33540, partial [Planctomycetota bacterium]|nr:hypothetical protein [Planctomycetota bacterium]